VAENEEVKTYTEDEVTARIQEALAGVKAEDDPAFKKLWQEAKTAKEKAKELAGKLTEAERAQQAAAAGITSQELDRLRSEVRVDLEKEYQEKYSDYEAYKTENRTLKLDNVVKGEMGKAGVRPERIDALYRLSQDQFDLTEDGKPMVKSRMGTPVSKFITDELGKEYPELFLGTGSSGGGATKSQGGAVGSRTIQAGDNSAFIANVERISKGEVKVAF
jgi:hypothetical protein